MHTPLPANRLRELRERHDLKLYDIAVLIRRDPSVIYRYEVGETAVPNDVMRLLAKRYEVSVEYLMGWDTEPLEAA